MVDKKAGHDYGLMTVVLLAAIMAIFILNSYASAENLSITGNVVKNTPVEKSKSCNDTDKGLDYSLKGRLVGNIPDGFYQEDRCFMHYFLREVYCNGNRASSHMIYCRGGCENGMCKEKNIRPKCGNGELNGVERCDGTNFNGLTCKSLGFIGGTLSCTKYCVLNTSGCTKPVCGNGVKEIDEVCDGNDLNNKTCTSFGFTSGTLKCVNCKFNVTDCTRTCSSDSECRKRICAGSYVHEVCDNGKCVLKSNCTTVKCAKEGEYTSGTVAPEYQYGCCAGLSSFYPNPTLAGGGALCYNPEKGTPVCQKQGTRSEGWYYPKTGTLLKYYDCDPGNATVPLATCTDSDNGKNYAVQGKCSRVDRNLATGATGAGVLLDACTDAKTLKECYCENTELKTIDYACPSGCANGACVEQRINISFCGDGMISPGEECDGAQLNDLSCASFEFSGGTLSCTPNCKFDTSKCTSSLPCNTFTDCPQPVTIPEYKECNGNSACSVTGGYDCVNSACVLNKKYHDCLNCTYGCANGACSQPTAYCGDGIVNVIGEECDSPDFGGRTCVSLGYNRGTLGCTSACKLDLSGCALATTYCGDGIVSAPNSAGFVEQCDGSDLAGMTCVALGFDSGTLSCGSDCNFDRSDCTAVISPVCGDGVINQNTEVCDGTNLGGSTCQSRGYVSGTLSCTGSCAFDTRGCSMCNSNGVCQPRMGETVDNCRGDCMVSPIGVALYLNPGSIDVALGDTISFDVMVSSVTSLFGYQFDLAYNPGVLELTGMEDGSFLSTTSSPFCVDYTISSGLIDNVACTKIGGSGVSGSGLLKRITFRAIATGTSDVTLSNAKLVDQTSATISAQVLSGQVSIS